MKVLGRAFSGSPANAFYRYALRLAFRLITPRLEQLLWAILNRRREWEGPRPGGSDAPPGMSSTAVIGRLNTRSNTSWSEMRHG